MDLSKFPLVLLAGGKGSRLGTPKGLIEFQGRPWLEEQFRLYAKRGGRIVVVVLGHQAEDYFKAMPWLEETVSERSGLHVKAVVNPKPESGQFSSLQTGLSVVAALADGKIPGAAILPVDVPCPDLEVWRLLAESFHDSKIQVSLPELQGKGGHPVFLGMGFIRQLLSIPMGSTGARLDVQIHRLPPESVKRVEVSDLRIHMNINTAEDWARYLV